MLVSPLHRRSTRLGSLPHLTTHHESLTIPDGSNTSPAFTNFTTVILRLEPGHVLKARLLSHHCPRGFGAFGSVGLADVLYSICLSSGTGRGGGGGGGINGCCYGVVSMFVPSSRKRERERDAAGI